MPFCTLFVLSTLQLQLTPRSENVLNSFGCSVHDQIGISFRDAISRRKDEHITIGTIGKSKTWNKRDAVLAQPCGMNAGSDFLAHQEWLFARPVLHEFDLGGEIMSTGVSCH